MTPSKLTLDAAGTIKEPDLHDAQLLGLLNFDSKKTVLLIKLRSGEIRGLRLLEVEHLNARDFKEGNLILDGNIDSGHGADCEQAFKDLEMADQIGSDFYLRTTERIGRHELKILTINPSYGCVLCAFCKEIEYLDEGCEFWNDMPDKRQPDR